jgi:hypothetical protein
MASHGEQTEPASRPPNVASKKHDILWRKGWRSIFLLGVTVALVLLGLVFRKAAATSACLSKSLAFQQRPPGPKYGGTAELSVGFFELPPVTQESDGRASQAPILPNTKDLQVSISRRYTGSHCH